MHTAPASHRRLLFWKRYDEDPSSPANAADPPPRSFNLPPAPAVSGAVPSLPPTSADDDDSATSVPSSVPQINYGDATPAPAPSPSDTGPTHNDTASTQPSYRGLNQTDRSAGSGAASDFDGSDTTHSTAGVIAGVVVSAVVLLALACLVQRYRRGFSSFFWRGSRLKGQRKRQRLGSSDKEPANSISSPEQKPFGDGFPYVSPSRAGASPMLSHQVDETTPSSEESSGQAATNSLLSVPHVPQLSHQPSLDSIAEVREPASGTSSHFRLSQPKRDSLTTPKRLTWGGRPHHPSRTSLTSCPSAWSSPDSHKITSKLSPTRPSSAGIEMTRQGSQLVIRPKASSSSLRLSARKPRDDTICIETDGIVEMQELRSKFSHSSLKTQRESNVTAVSPAGSFSFEIRDAIRLGAPLTLGGTILARANGEKLHEAKEADSSTQTRVADDEPTFVRDLDWDVSECSFADRPNWTGPRLSSVKAEDPTGRKDQE
ncbi:hypothetical protein PSEUBRA_002770 [Kalmanozyma brasiliensis GHG001]|uniref:uncharacterized protein n=1 Tax=Kalmanozyma brasiliensis (strain GHG001) TaxID=1365824 RepID=UPI002867F6CD|nr:uncharacterized protein PSEUBRA_002770 [Kalmanozyma brasiliensis GHG001]KAF6767130.1 hypothetical protein PSEUBRA_002770 [Kalmanozyma brasiliensis GHG001]